MPITYIVRFAVVPARRERFFALLDAVLDTMRHEPMFHQAVLHRDPEDENRLMLYETWEDHDDVLRVQLERPYRREWHAALEEVLEAPREIEVWQPVRADRRPDASCA